MRRSLGNAGTWQLVIPIGEDGGGNFLCLDYRDKTSPNPKITFWFHEVGGEDAVVYVCDTFTQLLEMLYVPADVIADREK